MNRLHKCQVIFFSNKYTGRSDLLEGLRHLKFRCPLASVSYWVTATQQVRGLTLNSNAESLGGVETLLTYPCTQTHADVPEEIRIANGITDCVLRISVGIEDSRDLIADLKEAMDSYDGYRGLYI